MCKSTIDNNWACYTEINIIPLIQYILSGTYSVGKKFRSNHPNILLNHAWRRSTFSFKFSTGCWQHSCTKVRLVGWDKEQRWPTFKCASLFLALVAASCGCSTVEPCIPELSVAWHLHNGTFSSASERLRLSSRAWADTEMLNGC